MIVPNSANQLILTVLSYRVITQLNYDFHETVNNPVHIVIEGKQTFFFLPFFKVVCCEGVISLTHQWLIWICDACYVNRPYVEFLQKFMRSLL